MESGSVSGRFLVVLGFRGLGSRGFGIRGSGFRGTKSFWHMNNGKENAN